MIHERSLFPTRWEDTVHWTYLSPLREPQCVIPSGMRVRMMYLIYKCQTPCTRPKEFDNYSQNPPSVKLFSPLEHLVLKQRLHY